MNCLLCFQKYQQKNLPRLLPVCGHTFCQNCLKLKMDTCTSNEIIIVCPIDQKNMLLEDRQINNFPKNISIIKEMNIITTKNDQLALNLSNQQIDKGKFLQNSIQKLSSIHEESVLKSSINISDQFQITESQICQLHQKKADIVCVQDHINICSSCALFGDHKGHHFVSIEQLNKDKQKKYQQIINIYQRKQCLCLNNSQKQSKEEVNKLLKSKRQTLATLIKEKHAKLYDILRVSQKRSLEKLNKCILNIEQKIRMQNRCIEESLRLYKDWESKALTKMEILQNKINLEQQIQIIYETPKNELDIIVEGTQIVNMIQNYNKHQKHSLTDLIQAISVQFDADILKKMVNYTSVFVKDLKQSSFLELESQKSCLLPKQNLIFDQNLLDQTEYSSSLSMKILQNQQKIKQNHLRFSTSPTHEISNKQILSPTSYSKKFSFVQNIQSPKASNAAKQLIKKKCKLRLPEKYQKIVQYILNDISDLLDLTNAEFGDQTILQILQIIKNKKVRVIKLVRNKLTDQIVNQIWPYISNVSTLNLSQNNLSDRVLDALLLNYKRVPNLKTIILSQNKIKQRNIKGKLQQIRKLDIIVSL